MADNVNSELDRIASRNLPLLGGRAMRVPDPMHVMLAAIFLSVLCHFQPAHVCMYVHTFTLQGGPQTSDSTRLLTLGRAKRRACEGGRP
jgi:hypothetical protein